MNVAGDHLVAEYGGHKAKQRAEPELELIKQLEDALTTCRAFWALSAPGNKNCVAALLDEAAASKAKLATRKDQRNHRGPMGEFAKAVALATDRHRSQRRKDAESGALWMQAYAMNRLICSSSDLI